MSEPGPLTPIWVRVVADPQFREALIADPLRALAEAGNVHASTDQVRQLEELDPDARAELVRGAPVQMWGRGKKGSGRRARRPAAGRGRAGATPRPPAAAAPRDPGPTS
jgi:hypothetical protein